LSNNIEDYARELAQQYALALDADESFDLTVVPKTAQARALEAAGYEAWLRRLGPRTFTGSFAFFHHELWAWYWPLRMKLLRGEQLTADELAMLVVWFRGGGKSSHVEWACIAEGALVGDGYVGYVSATEAMAKGHVQTIRELLDSPEIAHYYPGLAHPRIDKHGYQVGWRQDYLATASGWGIIPIGLEEGMRGGRQNALRFSMFVFDDIDSAEDSPAAVEKKEKIIARSILPAGTADTLVLFPQNLIHENSVLHRILTRQSDILAERKVSGPVPAFTDLELALDDAGGGRKWIIKSGAPTWAEIDMGAARKYLAKSGRAAFRAEYQHEFDDDKTELVLHNWRDEVHVITWSQFAAVYGPRRIPDHWHKYGFHDFARTKTAYHASVAGFVTVAGQNAPLAGCIFLYEPMSFAAGTETDDVGLRIVKALAPGVRPGGGSWDALVRATVTREGLHDYVTDQTALIAARREVLARVLPNYVRPILAAQHFAKWRMSHEAKTAREVLRGVFGLPFQAVNPGNDGGVDWLNHYLHVDETRPHPFRPGQLGSARFFLIVDDDKSAPPAALQPDALHDADLVRYQFKRWRNRPPVMNAAGIVEQGPVKMNDDFGNGLMMLFHDNCVMAAPLTAAEQCEAKLPPAMSLATIQTLPPEVQGQAYAMRDFMLRQMAARAAAAERRPGQFVNRHSFSGRR
jgi:hypothetical protein